MHIDTIKLKLREDV